MKRTGASVDAREGTLALTAVDEDVAALAAHSSVRDDGELARSI